MRSQITDRQKYISAHKKYNDLNDLLSNLSNKLSNVSKDIDKEFLSSYRVHMLAIQSEIKNLSEEVEKGVQALKSDQTIAKLEEEVTWFVDECTRLKMHFTTMINDYKQMQSRYNSMKEQKTYLSQQLKATMKINRVLQAEVDYMNSSNKDYKSNYSKEKSVLMQLQQDNLPNEIIQADLDEAGSFYGESSSELLHYHNEINHKVNSDDNEDCDDEHVAISEEQQILVGYPLTKQHTVVSPSYQESLLDQQRPEKNSLSTSYFIKSAPTSRSPSPNKNDNISSINVRTYNKSIITKMERLISLAADDHKEKNVLLNKSHNKSRQKQLSVHSNKRSYSCRNANTTTSKIHHAQYHKKQLILFLQKKSAAEASLEKSIASVFAEVKARKMASAKHGVVKRSINTENITIHSTDNNNVDGNGDDITLDNHHHPNSVLDLEVELLNQSLIQISGGISGLGTSQLSDNDRFSCIVKYLLNYDRFKEVVKRTQIDHITN